MLFSTRIFRPLCSSTLLLCVATSLAACSLQASLSLDESFSAGAGAGSSSENGTGGGSGGGGGMGGAIVLPTPQPPPDTMDSFTNLCGGGCMTNDTSLGCGNTMNPDGTEAVSCQIIATNDAASAVCLSAGNFGIGAPCESVADCAASLGCVRMKSGVGVCRPYCCGDVEACETGSVCAPLPMAENNAIHIPICAPTTQCTLLDDTTCPTGLTCTLVRTDGTTDCVVPGAGTLGQPCPCAPGHICSIDKCVALCHTGPSGSGECPTGKICQGGNKTFPNGVGVCVP